MTTLETESVPAQVDPRLEPRVVLVTGGASGLGAATARALAGAGMRVVVGDVDAERSEAAAEGIAAALDPHGRDRDGGVLAVRLDVRDPVSAEAAIGAAIERFGGLDVLVNNAGTDLTLPFEELPADAFDRVLDVNLRGPAIMTRAALPELKRRQGHVVNVASTAAFRGWPNASAYHASKWGLRGLGQGLFTELREHGVRVTTIFAGGMRTPFILERFPGTPLDVLQDPDNVAQAIRFALELPTESVVAELTVVPIRETSWP